MIHEEFDRAHECDYSVNFSTLVVGDVIPVFGKLYRVKSAGFSITLKLLGDQEVPKEARVDPKSFVIPIGGYARLRGQSFLLKAIETVKDGDKVRHRAVTDFYGRDLMSGENLVVTEMDGARPVADFRYSVRNIVPPDKKTGIIGWLELDPKPTRKAR